jgi:hypothetical protein
LYIDATDADFLGNDQHLGTIIAALEKEYEIGQHLISLP